MQSQPPRPNRFQRAIMFTFRTLFFTLLCTMAGMGIGLFVGIIGTAILNAVRHGGVDMSNAYRHVAIPVAILAGLSALLFQIIAGIRTALRPRT